MERTIDDGCKLHLERFHLDKKKKSTYCKKRVVHLDSLPRHVAVSITVGFQNASGQGAGLSHVGSFSSKIWYRGSLDVPSNLSCSMIL